MKIKYMHTIDGKPAFYVPGQQVCFASRAKSGTVILADSLDQIHSEQKASIKWRRKKRFKTEFDYDWLRVSVESD